MSNQAGGGDGGVRSLAGEIGGDQDATELVAIKIGEVGAVLRCRAS